MGPNDKYTVKTVKQITILTDETSEKVTDRKKERRTK